MKIGGVNSTTASQSTQNMAHVVGANIKNEESVVINQEDNCSISDQAKRNEKTGITSGSAGAQGAQATKKNKEKSGSTQEINRENSACSGMEEDAEKTGELSGQTAQTQEEKPAEEKPSNNPVVLSVGNKEFKDGIPQGECGEGENSGATGETEAKKPSQAEIAQQMQMIQQDMLATRKIMMEIMTSRMKHQATLYQIMMDTMTEKYKILNESMLLKGGTADRCAKAFSDTIMGGRGGW